MRDDRSFVRSFVCVCLCDSGALFLFGVLSLSLFLGILLRLLRSCSLFSSASSQITFLQLSEHASAAFNTTALISSPSDHRASRDNARQQPSMRVANNSPSACIVFYYCEHSSACRCFLSSLPLFFFCSRLILLCTNKIQCLKKRAFDEACGAGTLP